MSPTHDHEVNIIVNGRPKKVPGPSISFEEVVALAFNPVPPNAFFTVTWPVLTLNTLADQRSTTGVSFVNSNF
jgi:hypothetical protein